MSPALRRQGGMVFQRPTLKSIYENVVYGLGACRASTAIAPEEAAERSCGSVPLWEEVKDVCTTTPLVSGGQQQLVW